jgi:GAF domain-containing protein
VRWLWHRLRAAVENGIQTLIWAGLVALAVLLWSVLGTQVALPAWALALLVGGPLAAAGGLALARPRAGGAVLAAEHAWHLADALQTLQKVLGGTIPGVDVVTFVEAGLLQPARDFLTRRPGEDVRLSILVPEGGEWRMAFAAGYRLEARLGFSLPIVGSFSRHAFESGEIAWSDDLPSDPRFVAHPQAQTEYRSLVSLPIRTGAEVVAVLNVDSTCRDAFRVADFVYVQLLCALVEVVFALGGVVRSDD